MTNLPALPERADLVTPAAAVELERRIATTVAELDDVDVASEWLARADAVAAYLEHRDAHAPMLGAMRRIEARIGELLGEPGEPGRGRKRPHADVFHRERQREFRALAKAVDAGVLDYDADGADSLWRSSRRALLETVRDPIRAAERAQREAELAERRARLEQEARLERARLEALGERPFRLELGDVQSWDPGEPIDAIITDPPYVTADALDLYAELGRFAADHLADGGLLAAMTAPWLLPGVLRALERPELEYRWTIVWRFGRPRAPSTVDYRRRVFDSWKPIVVYHRGAMPADAPMFSDVLQSPGQAKGSHEWEQSLEGFDQIVTSLTWPGATVCDPFTGVGTTAVAALRQERRFVGCDNDPAAVDLTLRRLEP